MVKEILKAEVRNTTKESEVKALRKNGFVPAVLYGHHRDALSIQLPKLVLGKYLAHHGIGSTLDIDVEGKKSMVILKEIQRSVLKSEVIHVDFQELTAGEKVRVKLPIHFINKDQFDSHTTVYQEMLHEIEVQTLPKFLIDSIEVDVSKLTIGDSLKVMDLDVTQDENYEILSDLDNIIASLSHAKVIIEDDGAEETTEGIIAE